MKRTLLIDGDIFVYQATAANEWECDWGNDLWTLHGNLEPAKSQFDDTLSEIKNALKADELIVALTDKDNWRKKVMPSYKHHRVKTRKPITYLPLREYVLANYNTFLRPTLEGDDILGILATHPTLVQGEKIIVSIDKDMRTIPALFCDWKKGHAIEEISEYTANYNHMSQTLVGDTSDGYKGCPGTGTVGAAKLLAPAIGNPDCGYKELWPIVVAAFKKQGLGEEVALQNARVARICRAEDFDFNTKEVKLWNPPS